MATIESRIAGNKIRNEVQSDYTSPAIDTDAGYVDEKGRRLVEMQKRMRSAARFSELEDKYFYLSQGLIYQNNLFYL